MKGANLKSWSFRGYYRDLFLRSLLATGKESYLMRAARIGLGVETNLPGIPLCTVVCRSPTRPQTLRIHRTRH